MKKSHLLGLFFASCAVAAVLLLKSTPLHGYQVQSTPVCGTLEGSYTWTAAGSPYHVTCSLTIAQGASLVIESGTVVKMEKICVSRRLFCRLIVAVEPGASVTAKARPRIRWFSHRWRTMNTGATSMGIRHPVAAGSGGVIHVRRNDTEFLYGSLSLNHTLVRLGGYHWPTVTGTNRWFG